MRTVAVLALALVACAATAAAAAGETSLIERASAAVGSKDPVRLANLVGRQGAGITHPGIDTLPPPSRRHLFVRQLLAVLGASTPVCFGYNVGSDKTTVFFTATGLNWAKGGLDAEATGMLALHFDRPLTSMIPPRLVWVTPITREDIDLYGGHRAC
ncbi:MAG: hypothetical protein LW719_12835 [Comamonadaceae bacterium]|jgi:hypothetical protein|nr:hypothetical protein [Comamonadaceae bacterium]